MELAQHADLRLAQSQVLSPQMRQGLELLNMTALELNVELRQQMMVNPLLEEVRTPLERTLSAELPEEHVSGQVTERELDFTPDGASAENTLSSDDGYRDYFLQNLENAPTGGQEGTWSEEALTRRQLMFDRQVHQETLQEHLLAQVPLSHLSEEEASLAEALIAGIEEDGYFRGSLPDIEMVYGVPAERVERVLRVVQGFDPLGCGARTPQECLLAQMEVLEDSPWEDEVRALVEKGLEDLAARRHEALARKLGIAPGDLPRVVAELRRLNPHPGHGFRGREDESVYVRPEIFMVRRANGTWQARVTDRDLPRVRLSKRYLAMLEDPKVPAADKAWIRAKLQAAEGLLDGLAERQNTLQRVGQVLADVQGEALEKGLVALRPLTMQQVADRLGMHNTTVSRAVKGKYLRAPCGVVELRRFFTAGVATETGAVVSNALAQRRVKEIIEAEDPAHPLSDARIAELLKAKCGLALSRRTVVKYRELQNIPNSDKRRVRSAG